MICWITRNLISREQSLMLRIYKTLIRPHLEYKYCVQLWNPAPEHGNWSQILKIEGVQRRFTRMIDEVSSIYMRVVYKELGKSAKKCEKVRKSAKK